METFKPNNMGQPVHFPYNNNNNNLIMNPPYVNYMGQQPNLGYLKCRPVASREQAMASQIDLDGSLWVFTDVMNGKIYTKQINNDGTATFNTYAYVKEEIPQYTSNDFVTKEQFNRVIQSLMAAMKPAENGGTPAQNNEKGMTF